MEIELANSVPVSKFKAGKNLRFKKSC